MKKSAILFICIILSAGTAFAQESGDGTTFSSANSLQVSQIALSNWAAGGENSLSLNASLSGDLRNKNGKVVTELTADWLVGIFKTEGIPVRKSQDHLNIAFVSGYHFRPNFGFGVLAELTTQVGPSYVFDPAFVSAFGGDPVKGIKTGDFMSPGYLEMGAGFRYVRLKPVVNIVFAPLMIKQTYILNDDVRAIDLALQPSGLYGNGGDKIRTETGAQFRLEFLAPVAKNVTAQNSLKFFYNYEDKDIDTSWILEFKGKINEHLSASLHTTLLYDNDVDTDPVQPGKQEKVQIREAFGVAFTYGFDVK